MGDPTETTLTVSTLYLRENGQFALYPNNRMSLYDLSMTPDEPKQPDFKVSTRYYQVENGNGWGRLGDTDEYYWKTSEEKMNK